MERGAASHELSQTSTVGDTIPPDDTHTPRSARVLPRPLEVLRQTGSEVRDDSGAPETPKSPEATTSGDRLHQRLGSASITSIVEPPVSEVIEPSPAVVAGTINLAQDIEAQPRPQDSRRSRRRGIVEKMQCDRKKQFLFCLPWVKSARVRVALMHALTSGLRQDSTNHKAGTDLGLSLTQHIQTSELTILLLLIIVVSTVFFCYNMIRLCVAVRRGDRPAAANRGRQAMNPADLLRTGYAMPRRPIRVVLAQDEEMAGREAVTNSVTPPAYGFWRESVRLDPDRLYWQRNEAATREEPIPEAEPEQAQASGGRRPPSYVSEDGVSYVVDAMTASSTSTVMTMPTAGRGQTA
ncbi:hypothetical protein ISF_04438 [Cordyceps fumosorosea ARSEF 2679]|uniref:Uncharacterized protein n=1 Tax=Cordyceps fumosorosea (strain ARSEF 2679) TaxID=1081104 RepID=A0A167XJ03_CORFA|nr:hypothetical protein ISF_04438 [Cordyceps fumosorosea ARSEF 2679]OAA65028.1 hypothetical protein ISF_04438 [Cordyceps fumosorosea ARSEF 2679]